MRNILAFTFVLLSLTTTYGQNIYKDYSLLDTIQGEKLSLGTNGLSYSHSSEYGNSLNLNLNAVYSKWKYDPKLLYYFQANAYSYYNRTSYNDGFEIDGAQNLNRDYNYENINLIYAGAGVSYYVQPRKLFFSAAFSAELRNVNANYYQSESYTSNRGQGYLWTGIGYGRIDNAEGLAQAMNVSEALLTNNVIKGKLSQSTLKEINSKLFKFRNLNYLNKYIDDASIMLMKDIESVLLKNNEIDGPLDTENAVRLYQVIMNTSRRYFYYPKYIGSQIEVQLQTQAFSNEKPTENYLKIGGVYGYPVSDNTNLLITAAYRRMLNEDGSGYFYQFPSYYSFYSAIPDYFNNQISSGQHEVGVYSNSYNVSLRNHNSQFSLGFNITHSLNSTAGLNFKADYYYYPSNSNLYYVYNYYDPDKDEFTLNASGQLDYNIYSQLFSHLNFGLIKSSNRTIFGVSLGFEYLIF